MERKEKEEEGKEQEERINGKVNDMERRNRKEEEKEYKKVK